MEYKKQMTDRKRILFVYHNNFLFNSIGCNSYIFHMAAYAKKRGAIVDFFSVTNVWNNFDTFDELNKKYNLIDNLYLFSPAPDEVQQKPFTVQEVPDEKKYSFLGIPLWAVRKIHREKVNVPGPCLGWIKHDTIKYFEEIVNRNQYDVINVHYIEMAEMLLFASVPEKTKLVYTMQDANYMRNGFYQNGVAGLSSLIEYEIQVISRFNEVSAISFDEMFFLRKLLPDKKMYHLPHPLPANISDQKEKKIDILFLGFENTHNLLGMKWFIDSVLPHIDKRVRITVCGLIWSSLVQHAPDHIRKAEEWGVRHIDFAEDLNQLYSDTRVSICPLKGGSGMKIKVIDSLARGVPVVATMWGIDGFADKHDNGCIVEDDPLKFAEAINRLIFDPEYYNKIRQQGISYFNRFLSLDANRESLDQIFGFQKEMS